MNSPACWARAERTRKHTEGYRRDHTDAHRRQRGPARTYDAGRHDSRLSEHQHDDADVEEGRDHTDHYSNDNKPLDPATPGGGEHRPLADEATGQRDARKLSMKIEKIVAASGARRPTHPAVEQVRFTRGVTDRRHECECADRGSPVRDQVEHHRGDAGQSARLTARHGLRRSHERSHHEAGVRDGEYASIRFTSVWVIASTEPTAIVATA